MSSADLVPEEKAVPQEDLVCFNCNKKPEGDGAEMLRCSRCCGPSYCGQECQLAAWQDGHKTECTALATARLEQLVSGLEGEEGFDRFLLHFVDMAYEGKAFAPLELQWLRSVKQLCRTLLSKADRVLQWYLYSLMAEAAVAGGGMAMTIPERAKAEAAVKDLVSALTQHRAALLQTSPSRFILAINLAVQLLGALGRHSEGVALGRRELPGIEGLYAKGERKLRRHVALYMLQLTDWVLEAADGQWAQHCARMRQGDKDDGRTPEEQAAIAEEAHAELKAEAEGLALRALSFADDVHMGGEELFHFVCAVADLLTDRNAWDQVLPHGKRALELAPRHGIADAVNAYAQALFQLGNCTEAEKILVQGLKNMEVLPPSADREKAFRREISYHRHLGRVLLQRNELEDALGHATRGRNLIMEHLPPTMDGYAFAQVGPVWALGAEILEKMGKADKALRWDRDVRRMAGASTGAAQRRLVQDLVRRGKTKEAEEVARTALRGLQHRRGTGRLPSEQDDAALEVLAQVLEAGEASLAQSLRADVAETRAKRERLRQDLLERTREEAVAAAHKAREEREAWVGPSSDSGKGGKHKGKTGKGKKGKGKGKGQAGNQTGGAEPAAADAPEATEAAVQCSICRLDTEEDEDEDMKALACGHHFHGPCVALWAGNCCARGFQATCPTCREHLMY